MGLNADQYSEHLSALLPPGQAWTREQGTTLQNLLRALAEEFARVDVRAHALLGEVIPGRTLELLQEWELTAGLPDTCVQSGQTLQERRNALVAKLTNSGGQSKAFFIALAAYLGFTITITEYRPFRVGISAVGDALSNGDWIFTWKVNGEETTIVYFRAGLSAVGEPLRKWGNEILECVINQLKPAQTHVIFAYGA